MSVPRSRRTSNLGHELPFSTPVGHVLNAAESRPSGPSVGNLRINGPSLGRGGASALCHEPSFRTRHQRPDVRGDSEWRV